MVESRKFTIKELTVCGVFLCIAFVLSFLKIFSMPLGGSVTLCSMLFITLIGYMYGPKAGLWTAFSYGILQFIQKPEMYTPLQVIIDYGFAFTALGLSGYFRGKKLSLQLGYLIAITGRFIFSAFSGYVFFSTYTPDGWNPIAYSICYNAYYIYAEGIISLVIISIPAVRRLIDRIIEESSTDIISK